ncbi:hypothetical protein WA538_002498, partial [Blastocystis sp. DL]
MTEAFNIQKSLIVTEHERQNTLNRIIEGFADAIDAQGGFDDKSKTAMKCKKDGTKSGIMAMMERWFLIQELYGANKDDCLVPSDPVKDHWLRRELMEGGFSEEKADELDTQLVSIAKSEYGLYRERTDQINTEELLQVNLRTLVDNMLFTYNIGNGIRLDDTIKFSKDSYQKLLTQYEKNTPIATPQDRELFLSRLLLLFLRYNTVSGDVRGYQMALPESVFAYLQTIYHLQHECFASPMNACPIINSFCSRFPDTDVYFGSQGSFFDYSIEEGVFEANPPFVEECMIRNIRRINELLRHADENQKPLTFFIIVPRWNEADCESYNLTVFGTPERPESGEKSPYFVLELSLDKDTHYYRNGMAYRDDFSVMKARNNSLMLVLQSSKAREVMPINQDSFRKEVHANWDLEAPEYSVEIKMPIPGRRRYERGNGDVWTRRSGKRSYGGYDRSSGRRFKQT